ncbi:MAG: xylulose kinase [Spirochaetes bacterium GWD1_61_31]|nr:MAG: xylulose kinase [Spirochaetes bacterium GWB1_60_80]OHD29624.1 MAG: xylulose kinase [Spirochaetes bacterium GWC1_61_12]OHD37527.1 MAG: xylulose kinase [Spirochaetes bacterium GWD1_61_31]OHD41963.1 MAG: xylulose kinase [Spirochaetes bacterium GWE1_60_18]OHD61771.1 MAG: xylulose kinase [Spirochaetes bacterium GWF1_60_12]
MTEEKTIMALDLGTSGMKVALVTERGRILAWEAESLELILGPHGLAEQAPDSWWAAFLTAAKRLLSRAVVPAHTICAICCSTQGEGTVAINQDGKPLMNCILWMDMRGAAALKRQFGGPLSVNGASLARIARWIHLTGGMPSMTGKDPAGHMLYIRDHRPEIYEKTWKFLNVLDYLNLRLSGRCVATVDSILTSWVSDNRDPRCIKYHDGLVRASGIEADKLPDIVPCTEILGPIVPELVTELSLSPGTLVVAGAIDTSAAAIGSGAVQNYAAHLYIGTSSWMAAHVPAKKTDIGCALASVPCALPDRYLLTALQATAGGNLTFLRDNILYHQDELLQEAAVPDIFKVIDQIAARVPAGANGLLYTPWIWGERAPVEDRLLRAGLHNLSLRNTREDIIRAFLEGIALNTRWLLQPVQRFTGQPIGPINIVGGGAQSDVWCQIFADVLGTEIRQLADPVYANARGAAWIAAVALGALRFQDLPSLTIFKRSYQPAARAASRYNEKFAVFKDIHRRMRGIYHRLNRDQEARQQ